jgi:putative transposase
MPRPPRIDLPGWPVHVTQRGVNRCAIFLDDEDRSHYLRLFRDACIRWSVAVYAYVLMDNHVHLLLGTTGRGDLSSSMHCLGHTYVQAFNGRHGRVGTLWQGRFKGCLVGSENYLLAVMRYIELNPLRAAMVGRIDAYRWSSADAHLGLRSDPLVTPHALYLGMAKTPANRQAIWREWLRAGTSDDDLLAIRRHLARESPLGDERFQAMVEAALNRPVACLPRGRPRGSKRE